MSSLLRFFKYFQKYRYYFILVFPLSLFYSSTGAAVAYLVKPAIDEGFTKKNASTIKTVAIAIVLLYVARGVARVLSVYFMKFANQSIIKDLRIKFFRRVHNLPLEWVFREKSGAAVTKIISDTEIVEAISGNLLSIMKDPFAILFLIIVAVKMNPILSIISILCIPIALIPVRIIFAKVKLLQSKARASADVISEKMREGIQGARDLRVNSPTELIKKFEEGVINYRRNLVRSEVFSELSPAFTELIGALGVGIIIFIGGLQVIKGSVTAGSFFSFIIALLSIWEPLKRFSSSVSNIAKTLPSIERILNIIEMKERAGGNVEKKTFDHILEFKEVSFSYNSTMILQKINFSLKKEEKVAIVGLSGVGKSTLISLIPRFFDPQEGSILIDGVNIKDIKLDDLRDLIAFLDQEPFIFDDTIYKNILIGNISASYEEVLQAAETVGVTEFVSKLEKGFESMCGENGENLSVGQKHRIGIARAILKNAPIIILDEPTASLDPKTEEQLKDSFLKLITGKTVLIVSHKESTIKWADRVIVIEDGKIKKDTTIDKFKFSEL